MENKSILMSIQPKWVAKILNGEKTIEVRKKFPKDYVGWVYIYCTKGRKSYLYGDKSVYEGKKETFWCQIIEGNGIVPLLNGKVVARFWCDKVETIEYCGMCYMVGDISNTNRVANQSCLDFADMKRYLGNKNGYAIHISKLEVFDKAKELKDFKHWVETWVYSGMDCPPYVDDELVPLYKAPQSWCYIEGE